MITYGCFVTLIRHFILAHMILDLGKKLSWVALGWFVYQVTGSSLSIGIVISAATISPVLSSVLVGGMLDRLNRRRVMVLDNLVSASILALIPLLYWIDGLTLAVIVAVVFINGLLSSFTDVGSRSILPSFVEKEELESTNGINNMTSQVGYLLGPAIGGLSTGIFGAPMTVFFNVLCYVAAAFLFFLIPSEAYHRGMKSPGKELSSNREIGSFFMETREGFRLIRVFKPLMIMASVYWMGTVQTIVLSGMLTISLGTFVFFHPALRFKEVPEANASRRHSLPSPGEGVPSQ